MACSEKGSSKVNGLQLDSRVARRQIVPEGPNGSKQERLPPARGETPGKNARHAVRWGRWRAMVTAFEGNALSPLFCRRCTRFFSGDFQYVTPSAGSRCRSTRQSKRWKGARTVGKPYSRFPPPMDLSCDSAPPLNYRIRVMRSRRAPGSTPSQRVARRHRPTAAFSENVPRCRGKAAISDMNITMMTRR